MAIGISNLCDDCVNINNVLRFHSQKQFLNKFSSHGFVDLVTSIAGIKEVVLFKIRNINLLSKFFPRDERSRFELRTSTINKSLNCFTFLFQLINSFANVLCPFVFIFSLKNLDFIHFFRYLSIKFSLNKN